MPVKLPAIQGNFLNAGVYLFKRRINKIKPFFVVKQNYSTIITKIDELKNNSSYNWNYP